MNKFDKTLDLYTYILVKVLDNYITYKEAQIDIDNLDISFDLQDKKSLNDALVLLSALKVITYNKITESILMNITMEEAIMLSDKYSEAKTEINAYVEPSIKIKKPTVLNKERIQKDK